MSTHEDRGRRPEKRPAAWGDALVLVAAPVWLPFLLLSVLFNTTAWDLLWFALPWIAWFCALRRLAAVAS
jgi:hypothetical protein